MTTFGLLPNLIDWNDSNVIYTHGVYTSVLRSLDSYLKKNTVAIKDLSRNRAIQPDTLTSTGGFKTVGKLVASNYTAITNGEPVKFTTPIGELTFGKDAALELTSKKSLDDIVCELGPIENALRSKNRGLYFRNPICEEDTISLVPDWFSENADTELVVGEWLSQFTEDELSEEKMAELTDIFRFSLLGCTILGYCNKVITLQPSHYDEIPGHPGVFMDNGDHSLRLLVFGSPEEVRFKLAVEFKKLHAENE